MKPLSCAELFIPSAKVANPLQVLVNGESKQFEDGITLAELIHVLDLPRQRIAVELNHEVARRADWENTCLKDNDRVEIVHFVGGGRGV
jgi:thiamine biosynthesis protein ThiS